MLKFCTLSSGCLANTWCKFHQILWWLSWKESEKLSKWHEMTLFVCIQTTVYIRQTILFIYLQQMTEKQQQKVVDKTFLQKLVDQESDRVAFSTDKGKSNAWHHFSVVLLEGAATTYVKCNRYNTLQWQSGGEWLAVTCVILHQEETAVHNMSDRSL